MALGISTQIADTIGARVRREPYRIFFPLAIAIAFIGVGHWLAYAHGWSSTYSGVTHAQIQAGGYIGCFVLGFLMTALPRHAAAPAASFVELTLALAAVLTQVIALSIGAWTAAMSAQLAIFAFIAAFAGRRFVASRAPAPPSVEFVWVPLGLAIGAGGCVLAIAGNLGLGPSWLPRSGLAMTQQGFLIAIVLGVGGFLAPRLMGHPAAIVARPGQPAASVAAVKRRRVALHSAAAAALAASFVIEGIGAIRTAYALRAAVVTAELAWTARLFRRPVITDLYVRYLWMSLWSLAAGLWGVALLPGWRIALLHLVFVGGFSLMTFAVGTMVVLSHAGEAARLRGKLPALRFAAIAVAVALAVRLVAETQLDHYFMWLGTASTIWIAGAAAWIGYLIPRLVKFPEPRAFDRAHDEAKARILRIEERAPAS